MKAPITAPVARQTSTEAHHGHSLRVTAMPISAAAVPAVKPADRSISPSSSTKTRPIAITVTAEAWWMRLDRLNALVKVDGRSTEKTITSTISPSTAGSEPTSPPRTRAM